LIFILGLAALNAISYAEWHTSMGVFRCELREELVPITANNFIDLAHANFYDGLIFHRVVHDFVIQDGDPNGNGTGGPGYHIPDEFTPDLRHDGPGVLAMANAGPNTGGSQYYITLEATPWLDDSYSIFGHVIQGMDVVYAIGSVEVDTSNRPVVPVTIDSVRIAGFQIDSVIPADSEVVLQGGATTSFMVMTNELTSPPSFTWFVNGVNQNNDSFICDVTFDTAGVDSVRCVVSDGHFDIPIKWTVTVEGTGSNTQSAATPKAGITSIAPNPFNPETTIAFTLGQAELAQIDIYNLRGQRVRTVLKDNLSAGEHTVTWNGTDDTGHSVASGMYFARFALNNQTVSIRKLLLMK
jgi:peptidyl-prolyl cis-trans isomerase A (cyclophilin A)